MKAGAGCRRTCASAGFTGACPRCDFSTQPARRILQNKSARSSSSLLLATIPTAVGGNVGHDSHLLYTLRALCKSCACLTRTTSFRPRTRPRRGSQRCRRPRRQLRRRPMGRGGHALLILCAELPCFAWQARCSQRRQGSGVHSTVSKLGRRVRRRAVGGIACGANFLLHRRIRAL